MRTLLDGNLLVALCLSGHVHHQLAAEWMRRLKAPFATCAVTEGTLLRLHMTMAEDPSAEAAWQTLEAVRRHPRHEFWELGFSYHQVSRTGLLGARQVTAAWLAQACRKKKARLATLDAGLASLHPDVATLVR